MTSMYDFPRLPTLRLSDEQEYHIWILVHRGIKVETVANLYGVTRFTVRQIAKRKSPNVSKFPRRIPAKLARNF